MQGPVWLYRLYIYRFLRQSHIYIYTFRHFTYIYPSNLYRVARQGRYVDTDPSKALASQCSYEKFVTTRWSLQTPTGRYSPPEEPKPSVLLKNRCRRIRYGPFRNLFRVPPHIAKQMAVISTAPQPSGARRWNLDVRPTSAKLVSHCCTTAPNTCKRRGADFSQPLPTWNGENVEGRDPDVPGRTRVQSRHSSLAGRRRAPAGRVAFRRQLDPVDCKPSVAVPLTRRARWRVPHEGAPPTARSVSLPRTRRLKTGTQAQRLGRRIGSRLTKQQWMLPPAIEVHIICSKIRDSCRCASNGWRLTQ
jgi:hypothetical protein